MPMLETRFPRPPGDVGHDTTFAFAVRRAVVHGATPERIVRGGDAAALAPFFGADALRRATGLPVHDAVTMLNRRWAMLGGLA